MRGFLIMKPIEIGFEKKVVFYPRMISQAEEDAITRRLRDVADEEVDRYQNEFEICREALGEYSAAMPMRYEEVKGELVKVPLTDAETPAQAVADYFKERTIENERIIRDAYYLFREQLRPAARFL